MRPSSTSSSEPSVASTRTLERWPRPTRAGWIAIALLVAARLALAALSDRTMLFDVDEGARAYFVNEARYRNEGPRSPEVVVLGTSRLLGLERRRLDVPASASILTQPGNTFYDAELLVQRNPALLSQCRVLAIDVVPSMLLTSPWWFDRTFLRYASAADRLAMPSPWRERALVDRVVPLWSERHTLDQWISGAALLSRAPSERATQIEARWRRRIDFNRAMSAARRRKRDTDFNAHTLDFVAPRDAAAWDLRQLAALDALQAALPAGCRPLVFVLPLRDALREAIEAESERAASWARFEGFVKGLGERGFEVRWLDDPAALAIADDDYVDGLHFRDDRLPHVADLVADLVRPLLVEGDR